MIKLVTDAVSRRSRRHDKAAKNAAQSNQPPASDADNFSRQPRPATDATPLSRPAAHGAVPRPKTVASHALARSLAADRQAAAGCWEEAAEGYEKLVESCGTDVLPLMKFIVACDHLGDKVAFERAQAQLRVRVLSATSRISGWLRLLSDRPVESSSVCLGLNLRDLLHYAQAERCPISEREALLKRGLDGPAGLPEILRLGLDGSPADLAAVLAFGKQVWPLHPQWLTLALELTVAEGRSSAAAELLRAGAPPISIRPADLVQLMVSSEGWSPALCAAALETGAIPQTFQGQVDGFAATLAQMVLYYGRTRHVAEMLQALAKSGVALEGRACQDGLPAPGRLAMMAGVTHLNALVTCGASLTHRDEQTGATLLHDAVELDAPECVHFLLRHGASVTATDHQGRDACALAHSLGHVSLAHTLETFPEVVALFRRLDLALPPTAHEPALALLQQCTESQRLLVEMYLPKLLSKSRETSVWVGKDREATAAPLVVKRLLTLARHSTDEHWRSFELLLAHAKRPSTMAQTLQTLQNLQEAGSWGLLHLVVAAVSEEPYASHKGQTRDAMVNAALNILKVTGPVGVEALGWLKRFSIAGYSPRGVWSVMWDFARLASVGGDCATLARFAAEDAAIWQTSYDPKGYRAHHIEMMAERLIEEAEGTGRPQAAGVEPVMTQQTPLPPFLSEALAVTLATPLSDLTAVDLHAVATLHRAFDPIDLEPMLDEPDIARAWHALLAKILGRDMLRQVFGHGDESGQAQGAKRLRPLRLAIRGVHPDRNLAEVQNRANQVTSLFNAVLDVLQDANYYKILSSLTFDA